MKLKHLFGVVAMALTLHGLAPQAARAQNNGTLVGSPAFVAGATGFGQSLSLAGSSSVYVSIPEPGPFTVTNAAPFFVSVRLKTTSTAGTLIALGENNGGRSWWIGTINGNLTASAGSQTANLNGGAIADGAWHTVALAMTANNGTASLFLDGTLVTTQASPSASNATGGGITAIGNYHTAYPWIGQIDEVAFYNAAIHTLAYTAPTAPTSPSDTNLVALYHLDSTAADYATGGALVAPALFSISASATGVTLVLSAATGGTGPYTYQWYKNATSNFTPGAGNILAGQTALTLTDTPPTPGLIYYYKVSATDSAGTPATATSLQIAAAKWFPGIKILFIGDSITHAYGVPAAITAQLALNYPLRAVNFVEAAVSGSYSTQWISSSANLVAAKSAAVTAFGTPNASTNPVYVIIKLGVNDPRFSPPGNSPATFTTNMTSMLSDLVAAGYTPILDDFPSVRSEPTGSPYDTDAGIANAQGIRAALDALANGKTVLRGDNTMFAYLANHPEDFLQDVDGAGGFTYVHPSAAGVTAYANAEAAGFMKAVGTLSATTTGTKRRLQ